MFAMGNEFLKLGENGDGSGACPAAVFDDGLADVGVEVDPGLEAFAAPIDVDELAVVPTELGVVDAAAFELIEATQGGVADFVELAFDLADRHVTSHKRDAVRTRPKDVKLRSLCGAAVARQFEQAVVVKSLLKGAVNKHKCHGNEVEGLNENERDKVTAKSPGKPSKPHVTFWARARPNDVPTPCPSTPLTPATPRESQCPLPHRPAP